MSDRITLTDKDLLYAATARCRCGAGLAYPMDRELSWSIRAWVCSAVLKGEVESKANDQTIAALGNTAPVGEHDSLPWVFWKVREETSINNRGAYTTRPPGTIARTVGKAKCPTCSHEWQSEPYDARGLSHHWFSGPCPKCGHAIGGGASYSSKDGPPIESRYLDVVLECQPHDLVPDGGKHVCRACGFTIVMGDGV